MGYTVGELARLAHVSVRALHHYDEIGLLVPSGRTRAGYRLYGEDDLARLQQILLLRALGFALPDVARVLDDPAYDRRSALVAQRALLASRAAELGRMVELVDRELAALEGGTAMTNEEKFGAFRGFDAEAHAAEAERRWGQTPEWAESARRTKAYGAEDWARIEAEQDAIARAFADALAQGTPPADPRAMDLAERARLFIDRTFYPCSRPMHAALGRMYVDDPRFAASYEKYREGLAQYVCDAIGANAARA